MGRGIGRDPLPQQPPVARPDHGKCPGRRRRPRGRRTSAGIRARGDHRRAAARPGHAGSRGADQPDQRPVDRDLIDVGHHRRGQPRRSPRGRTARTRPGRPRCCPTGGRSPGGHRGSQRDGYRLRPVRGDLDQPGPAPITVALGHRNATRRTSQAVLRQRHAVDRLSRALLHDGVRGRHACGPIGSPNRRHRIAPVLSATSRSTTGQLCPRAGRR